MGHLGHLKRKINCITRFSPGTPVTPGRMTNRTPYLTGTPGAITPGEMSMAAGTPYGSGASTPRQRPSGMTPSRHSQPLPQSSRSMPPPPSGGSTPMARSGRSHQPSPMYGSSSSGSYGRSPAVGRSSDRDRGGWQEASDAWARGSSRRTPRTNDGGHTPKGN